MTASLSSRIAVAALTCGLALAGPAMGSASAEIRHGGGHYYGGYYAPGCIPVLGIVTGNYCGYYN